eukprot:TRINITY_DN6247_c0_g4_i1.p3 TRINITY_DN6247_c0_g4~~TRINITY_DN6247_c0_g4_i1.p3  ORF type:complete len:158 (+),score=3.01 TRINITY_DN6247_c0_g4_i1:326-799(+)
MVNILFVWQKSTPQIFLKQVVIVNVSTYFKKREKIVLCLLVVQSQFQKEGEISIMSKQVHIQISNESISFIFVGISIIYVLVDSTWDFVTTNFGSVVLLPYFVKQYLIDLHLLKQNKISIRSKQLYINIQQKYNFDFRYWYQICISEFHLGFCDDTF